MVMTSSAIVGWSSFHQFPRCSVLGLVVFLAICFHLFFINIISQLSTFARSSPQTNFIHEFLSDVVNSALCLIQSKFGGQCLTRLRFIWLYVSAGTNSVQCDSLGNVRSPLTVTYFSIWFLTWNLRMKKTWEMHVYWCTLSLERSLCRHL